MRRSPGSSPLWEASMVGSDAQPKSVDRDVVLSYSPFNNCGGSGRVLVCSHYHGCHYTKGAASSTTDGPE